MKQSLSLNYRSELDKRNRENGNIVNCEDESLWIMANAHSSITTTTKKETKL